MRIMVASRWGWRLSLHPSISCSTSDSVRYSRVRTSAFLGRRGVTFRILVSGDTIFRIGFAIGFNAPFRLLSVKKSIYGKLVTWIWVMVLFPFVLGQQPAGVGAPFLGQVSFAAFTGIDICPLGPVADSLVRGFRQPCHFGDGRSSSAQHCDRNVACCRFSFSHCGLLRGCPNRPLCGPVMIRPAGRPILPAVYCGVSRFFMTRW